MLIVTYGERKYKIQLNLDEDKDLEDLCRVLTLDKLKVIQLIFRIGLRSLLKLWF